jgi:hypothetical protein
LTAKNSSSNGPSWTVCSSATGRSTGSMRCSRSFAGQQREGEAAAHDRDVAPLAQQVRHGAEVVLVPWVSTTASMSSSRSRM